MTVLCGAPWLAQVPSFLPAAATKHLRCLYRSSIFRRRPHSRLSHRVWAVVRPARHIAPAAHVRAVAPARQHRVSILECGFHRQQEVGIRSVCSGCARAAAKSWRRRSGPAGSAPPAQRGEAVQQFERACRWWTGATACAHLPAGPRFEPPLALTAPAGRALLSSGHACFSNDMKAGLDSAKSGPCHCCPQPPHASGPTSTPVAQQAQLCFQLVSQAQIPRGSNL